MGITDKKKNIILAIQATATNDEQLIEEVYELLHPAEAIENIAINNCRKIYKSNFNRALDDIKRPLLYSWAHETKDAGMNDK